MAAILSFRPRPGTATSAGLSEDETLESFRNLWDELAWARSLSLFPEYQRDFEDHGEIIEQLHDVESRKGRVLAHGKYRNRVTARERDNAANLLQIQIWAYYHALAEVRNHPRYAYLVRHASSNTAYSLALRIERLLSGDYPLEVRFDEDLDQNGSPA